MPIYTRREHYRSGDWLVTCDQCGREIWSSEAYHRWDGLIVCEADYETRHPQEMIRGIKDRQGVVFASPEPDDNFLTTNEVTEDDF